MATQSVTNPEQKALTALYEVQRRAWLDQGQPGYDQRMANLERLVGHVRQRTDDIVAAINTDFGNRSVHETLVAEVYTTVTGIRYLQKHLKKWMQPEKRGVSLIFAPAKARVFMFPRGVTGIMSPWNYPFYLAMLPLATSLAAGNRVMLKPSELSPATSDLMVEMLAELFPENLAAGVTGGPEVGDAFSRLPLDYLLFTGSTSVGRIIMRNAAENLVPVTLELGGKSPAIVAPDYDLDLAAERIAAGKFFNAGQTCVAPDYALVPENVVQALAEKVERAVRRFYPSLATNPDYTAIINDRHHGRLAGLVKGAAEAGANVVTINPAREDLDAVGKFAPTLILDCDPDLPVMTDEIFGPILPVLGYRSLEQAVDFVNNRPRPLAFYYFDEDDSRVDEVMDSTISGGVCVNDVMIQVAVDDLPFGGVGLSGMGLYHGREGFESFSHKRSILFQRRPNGQKLLLPPYSRALEKGIRLLIRRAR